LADIGEALIDDALVLDRCRTEWGRQNNPCGNGHGAGDTVLTQIGQEE